MAFGRFTYASGKTPRKYKCGHCGATGVRLYRRYQTCMDAQDFLCRKCVCEDQKQEPTQPYEHQCGWFVAAVPTEDGKTCWGFTSVPDAGVVWWDALPKSPNEQT